MNKLFKFSIIMLLIILIFAQIFCIKTSKKDNNITVYKTQNYKYNNKPLKEINNDLNCLKDKCILSASKTDGKWHVKIKISGSKEELLNEISKLKKYDISNYIISRSEKENVIILEINAKENA